METLPNGVTYPVLDLVNEGIGDNTEVYKVPEGHFFMMGDNRDNSTDSRFLSEVGFVPFENLVGHAKLIFFSIDEDASFWQIWKWPTDVRWSRHPATGALSLPKRRDTALATSLRTPRLRLQRPLAARARADACERAALAQAERGQ